MPRRIPLWLALLLLGCGSASKPSAPPPKKARTALVAEALDDKRPVRQRLAALVALQARKDTQASAKATIALRTHRDHRLATAAAALWRVSTGRAAIRAQRVAVIGASLSAGVGAKPLAQLLQMALPPGAKVVDCADLLTYEAPRRKTRAQLRRAAAAQADVILAIDTLFWFAYHNRSAAHKRAYLATGLKVLEDVKVPLLLGDLPDMRTASAALIPKANLPSPELLAELNRTVRKWAASRPQVHVLPFGAWARPLLSQGRITTAPGQKPMNAADALLADGLHPNHLGTLYILHRVFSSVHRAFPRTAADRLHTTKKLVEFMRKL